MCIDPEGPLSYRSPASGCRFLDSLTAPRPIDPGFCFPVSVGLPIMPRSRHTACRSVASLFAQASALWLPLAAIVIAAEPAARPTTPPETRRGWIEPASAPAPPSLRPAPPPATLRLPTGSAEATPIGSSLPDLPAAAEFDQQLIAAFTTTIQPLLLNRCASGRCHGGADACAPRLTRRGPGGTIDRTLTLANIDALCGSLHSDPDPSRLLVPAARPHGGSGQPPLSGEQLQRLATWIDAALAQRKRWAIATAASFEEAVVPPSTATPGRETQLAPAAATDNRFRRLLEKAGNPDPLPPPQQPPGIIDFEKFPEAGPQAD